MQKIKTACLYIVLGFAIMSVSRWMKSTFLTSFLLNNLLTVIITVLAINAASVSNILSKLDIINAKIEQATGMKKNFFSKTKKELKNSCIEQLFMIAVAIICSTLYSAECFNEFPLVSQISEGGLASVFVWNIFVLKDVISALFELSDFNISAEK